MRASGSSNGPGIVRIVKDVNLVFHPGTWDVPAWFEDLLARLERR